MAWYRAGGGGIPSSLKTDMNAVLNKKFGTSTTYPPNGWPDDVNLLGPLPERTASGSIAHITDGADAVPLKNWAVTLPASLSGYSSIDCTRAKKNLLNDSVINKVGGNYYFGGATSATTLSCFLRAGTYTITLKLNVSVNVNIYMRDIDTDSNVSGFPSYNAATTQPVSKTFTLTEDTNVCVFTANANYQSADDIDYCMIEVGSSPSSYSPYTAPTTQTVNLGRTVYGGTVDVVQGTAEPFNLVSLNRSPQQAKREYGITINTQNENTLNITTTGVAYACERLFYSLTAGTYAVKFLATSSDSFTPDISIYRTDGTDVKFSIPPNTITTFTLADDTDIDIRLFASKSGDTTIRTVEFTNLQIEKGSTVHEYSPYFAPFTFTPLTPTPETALGVNNLWADAGDSEVTYRADIDLLLGGN